MVRISHDIIFSAMAHFILLAAALLIGGSSEIRKASLMTIALFDETDDSSPSRQAAPADMKQNGQALLTPKAATRTVTTLSLPQELIPKRDLTSLGPEKPQAGADSGSAPVKEMGAQSNSSDSTGNGSYSVSSQALLRVGGEPASVSRNKSGQGTGTDSALKQRIRDALQSNLVYPYIARKRRMEGTVLMEFRINGKGMPEGVRIVKGSRYPILDEAARETVVKASPYASGDHTVEVPIRFSLRED